YLCIPVTFIDIEHQTDNAIGVVSHGKQGSHVFAQLGDGYSIGLDSEWEGPGGKHCRFSRRAWNEHRVIILRLEMDLRRYRRDRLRARGCFEGAPIATGLHRRSEVVQ